MFQVLAKTAGRLVADLHDAVQRRRSALQSKNGAARSRLVQPLQRVFLTDGVVRTLFDEYADHRASACGEEETGWVILGHRDATEATVMATLPAGTQRQAGVAHIRFNTMGQAVGGRIVRQADRRLLMLGVVHTHPGSLRHPSDGDFRADRSWVTLLRGHEGIFGIGTADGVCGNGAPVSQKPRVHLQTLGNLCLSWYRLRQGDDRYHPVPVELVLGPDLARPLHSIWPTIENHAEQLDRLARQQVGVKFDLVEGRKGPALAVTVPLAEPGKAVRVLLEGKEVRYFVVRGGEYLLADGPDGRVDQGVAAGGARVAMRNSGLTPILRFPRGAGGKPLPLERRRSLWTSVPSTTRIDGN